MGGADGKGREGEPMAKARRGRDEGSIEELPSGKFRARVSTKDPATGARRMVTRAFDTKREALSFRDELLRKKRAGLVLPEASTLGKWLDDWLAVQRTQLDPRSHDQLEQH